MFDFSFSELMVTGVVALVVVGPERMPRVARIAGALLGRFRRYASDVKAEVSREVQFNEVNRLQQDVNDNVQSLGTWMSHEMTQIERTADPTIADGEGNSILPAGTQHKEEDSRRNLQSAA